MPASERRAVARRALVLIFVLLCAGASAAVAQTSSVPAPWKDLDIGSPPIAGDATMSSGKLTVNASGADIWGTADQFHFVYQPVTGDVDVRVRVDSITYASNWSKAGVMIRGALTAGAAHGYALASAGKGLAFQRRLQAGGLSTNTAGEAAAPPRWLRLVRRGNVVTAYSSSDGASWTTIGSDTIQLGTTAYVGVAVTSHSSSSITTAGLSNLAVAPVGLPSSQADADIGSPTPAGGASYSGGKYSITAGGADIWGSADQFHYVYQPATGDIDVTYHVTGISYAHAWSKAGVMIRETLGAGSAHAYMLVSAGKGYAFQRRATAGGQSLNTDGGTGAAPGWVRLTRNGNLFTAYRSADGVQWTVVGTDSIPMASTVYVGIAVTSHNSAATTTTTGDSFTVKSLAGSPSPVSVAFQPSADHATLVTKYVCEVFAAGVDTTRATPMAQQDLGKPGPDASGTITSDITTLYGGLAAGSYQVTVSAVGSGGSSRSTPVPLTK